MQLFCFCFGFGFGCCVNLITIKSKLTCRGGPVPYLSMATIFMVAAFNGPPQQEEFPFSNLNFLPGEFSLGQGSVSSIPLTSSSASQGRSLNRMIHSSRNNQRLSSIEKVLSGIGGLSPDGRENKNKFWPARCSHTLGTERKPA